MNLRDGVYWLDGAPVDAVYLGDEEVYRAFLVDNFDARDTLGAKWTLSSPPNIGTLVIDGMARFVPDPDPVNGGLDLYLRNPPANDRPIAETMVTVELAVPPASDTLFSDAYLDVTARTVDTGAGFSNAWWMSLDFEQGDLTHYGSLNGESGVALKRMPVDRQMMRWLRLRFTGGVVHSEYSPDGLDWTIFHSVAWGGEVHPRYRAMLSVYSDPGVSEVAFDNFSWVAL